MAVNTRRNSTTGNNNVVPTVTIVDSVDKNDRMASCCFCVPEVVGVFAILLMHFFLGIFSGAASFVSLGYAADITDKVMLGVSGSLYTFTAIISALGVSAIRKEKIVLVRRLSVAFWTLTALIFIFNIINFVLDYESEVEFIQDCQNNVQLPDPQDVGPECKHLFNAALTSEGIRVFVTGIISMYFSFVVFRFARRMKKEVIPFTIAPVIPKTPTYFVYSTQPPTSNTWVPPPTYSVNPTQPLPDDFNPDSKIPIN